MSIEWREGPIFLKFQLGEITLHTATYRGFVLNRPFNEVAPDDVPLPTADAGAAVWLIRSQPVAQMLPPIGSSGKWIRYVPHQYKRYYVDLRGDFDGYLKRFSSKTRSTLTRKVRKFAEASGGEIEWRAYTEPRDIDAFFAGAGDLSRKTYQERLLGSGLPTDEEFVASIRDAAAHAEARGYLLFLKAKPVAYVLCPVREGVLGYQYVGFDPDCHQLSPGTVLQYLILKQLYDEGGYRIFDFTEGEGQQKAFFATHNVYCADIYFMPNRVRNAATVRLHRGVDLLSGRIGTALDRLGLKSAVKRLVRKMA